MKSYQEILNLLFSLGGGGTHLNSNTWEAEVDRSELDDSLVYRVNSRTARSTQRNPVLNKQKKHQGHALVAH